MTIAGKKAAADGADHAEEKRCLKKTIVVSHGYRASLPLHLVEEPPQARGGQPRLRSSSDALQHLFQPSSRAVLVFAHGQIENIKLSDATVDGDYVKPRYVSRLSSAQQVALRHDDTARRFESPAVSPVTNLLQDADRTLADYNKALECIRSNARVVVHFHPDRLRRTGKTVAEFLLEDGIYRNQFETGWVKRQDSGVTAHVCFSPKSEHLSFCEYTPWYFRHGRACPGHPRFACRAKDVDARDIGAMTCFALWPRHDEEN
jgi:hypothetical protein